KPRSLLLPAFLASNHQPNISDCLFSHYCSRHLQSARICLVRAQRASATYVFAERLIVFYGNDDILFIQQNAFFTETSCLPNRNYNLYFSIYFIWSEFSHTYFCVDVLWTYNFFSNLFRC